MYSVYGGQKCPPFIYIKEKRLSKESALPKGIMPDIEAESSELCQQRSSAVQFHLLSQVNISSIRFSKVFAICLPI